MHNLYLRQILAHQLPDKFLEHVLLGLVTALVGLRGGV